MKHRKPEVLYFSIDDKRINAFWSWVKYGTKESLTYKKNFLFERVDSAMHNHSADLSLFLEQYKEQGGGNLQSLHVIIDIESIPSEQVDLICNTVIQYPEVQFLFDRRGDGNQDDLRALLFPKEQFDKDVVKRDDRAEITKTWGRIKDSIQIEFLEINWETQEEEDDIFMRRIIGGYDNTFDASNLRYAIKYRKYISLKVDHNQNFRKLQESRNNHLAICVEEEIRQNIVNSYALYANGYRVLPISMRKELELTNQLVAQNIIQSEYVIVVRDYDLQFEDEDERPVDEIRGYKYIGTQDELDSIRLNKKGQIKPNKVGYKLYWNDFTSIFENRDNHYWSSLKQYPIYFVSKASKGSHIEIVHPNECSEASICIERNDQEKLVLPGFSKPVCGIYSPFHGINEIGGVDGTYRNIRYFPKDTNYYLKTSRKDHDHSTPLDIYEMVNSMIRRAESYYEEKRYLLAALVSGEAIEVLNGFHHRLMVKAYFIQSEAENAIAMDVVGGNEQYLAKDALFRVAKIKADISRFYYGHGEKSSRNVLNQIFSTCRQFCKENEHFESEEVFLSAIGHLNEGFGKEKLRLWINTAISKLRESQSVLRNEDLLWYRNEVTALVYKILSGTASGENYKLIRKYEKLTKQDWSVIHVSTSIYIGFRNNNEQWSSSNPGIVSVNKEGLLIPHQCGYSVVFSSHSDSVVCYPVVVEI